MVQQTGDVSPFVQVDSVEAFYGKAQALFDVSFDVTEGSVSAIIGPNGAGKTTLLDCLTGFKEYRGQIVYNSTDVESKDPWELGGNEIGYCTERNNLFGDLTVLQNLRLGSYDQRADFEQNIEQVFDLFPRLDQRQTQTARTLSGGEQKMLAIARCLVGDPNLLILDEPSLGLAPTVVKDIHDALVDIINSGMTLLIAEQDVSLALDLADEIMLLENGQIEYRGTSTEFRQNEQIHQAYFE